MLQQNALLFVLSSVHVPHTHRIVAKVCPWPPQHADTLQ
jgi:hypothetical protein